MKLLIKLGVVGINMLINHIQIFPVKEYFLFDALTEGKGLSCITNED